MRFAAALLLLACVACGSVAPTPVATPLGVAELKFKLMDSLGKPAYCDPDFYPVAREGAEQARAIQEYPAIVADVGLYSAILAHERIVKGELTDAEKLIVYRAWKLLRALSLTPSGAAYSFQYRVLAQAGGSGFEMLSGTISADGKISLASRTPTGRPVCPICLAASTLIATPGGEIPVTELMTGTVVWTVSAGGSRVAAPVVLTGSTPVPAGHVMVHLELADGRTLLASPGHRTGDGRALGALAPGEVLDGSVIVLWELVPYAGDRTYDLLPAGATGEYWANGVLLASTLKP